MANDNFKKSLNKLKTGQDAVILAVKGKDKALRSHILDMGLTPGVEVTLVKTAPLGDPLEIRLRGYELTLRKSDAANIIVTNVHDAHAFTRKNLEFRFTEHSKKGEVDEFSKKEKEKFAKKTTLKLALVGNQNCGKTTLFNQLTGSHQRVGNFPGVTVDRTDGIIKGDKNAVITDLPGI